MNLNISAVVLTRNEEVNIVDCLERLMFCNEIIIIDDYSTDRTGELIKRLADKRIKIFKRELNNDFSAQRQFGIDNATNNWILFVDADERISSELATEIRENVTPNTKYGGFLIKRTDFMWKKELKHGETGKIKLLRLFDKRRGELVGKVHEKWVTKKMVGQLENPILHYPHPSISEFLKEINFYTDLRAEELYKKGEKTNFVSLVLYTKGKFFINYFVKMGFLDGLPGLIHAILMSFHSFMVRGKLWLLWEKKHAS